MGKPLKIVHVETGRHLYGGALQVVYLLRGLQQQGVHNILVCPEDSEIASAAASLADVRTMPCRGDLDAAFMFRLLSLLRREKPDLVHLHSRRGADLWGGLAGCLSSIPTVLTRRVDNPEPSWWAAIKYRLYDHIITISDGIRRVLLAEGIPDSHLTCVPSAVDNHRFKPGCIDRSWFEQEFGLKGDTRVIGVVAQLIPRKGHRHLFSILPALVNEFPMLRVLIFGRGPLEAELKKSVEQMGLTSVVRFAGFRNDLERILPCLDMLVHPAEMEGLGVSLLQAASCGVPLIAFASGGIPEIIRDGENGFLVPVGDTEVLRKRIKVLLEHPGMGEAMGIRGRIIVTEVFSLEAMVRGNMEVYRLVLGDMTRETG